MANAILNSNASSSLVAALDSVSATKNPLIYSYGSKNTLGSAHVPAHSRTVVEAQSTSYGWNQNIDFHIIKAGQLENCFLKLTIANNAANHAAATLNTNYFNLIVEEIQLLTAGKVIMRNVPFGRACLVSQKSFGVRKNIEGLLKISRNAATTAIADNASATGYVPLLFSCFDVPELMYNSSFCEPMIVRVRLSTDNKYSNLVANPQPAQSMSLTAASLIQVHRQMPSQLEQAQISANYSDTESLVRVQNEVVCEETSKTAGGAGPMDITHTLTTNRCINKLFVAVEDQAAGSEGQYLELTDIEVKANGQTVLSMPAELVALGLNLDTDRANSGQCVGNFWEESSATQSTPHTQRVYCINFGMNSDHSAHLTNVVSAREINAFTVKASFSAAGATEHKIHIGALTPFLESINSASGKISTSLSS